MRRSRVVGNWKMHGSLADNQALLAGLQSHLAGFDGADVAVCPPYVYLAQALDVLADSVITVGAQNCALEDSGAFTGEVAAGMLKDIGCTYVIAGHSERRALYGETDATVAGKVAQVLANDMQPILCVGETLEEREQGKTLDVVGAQVQAVVDVVGIDAWRNITLAYEPVWAIGTGKTASPEQAQEVHAFLRSKVAEHNSEIADKLCILYGGSVKADNAEALFAMADLDGALVGGASLKADDFAAICKAAG